MKFSAASVFAMAAVASAQSIADIPTCAAPCLTKYIGSETKCELTDIACVCKPENMSAVQSKATTCVLDACKDKTADVLTAVKALCAGAGSSSSQAPVSSSQAPGSSSQAPTTVQSTQSSAPTQSTATTTVAPAPTASGNGTAPHTSSVTAGAAGFAPLAGAAVLAAAMAL